MARPEPWRLDAGRYPRRFTLQTRYQDLDPNDHLNNVAYAAMFESARVRFNEALGVERWSDLRWVIASVELNYLAEGGFPADVEVAIGVGEVGRRSWRLLCLITQEGRPLATGDAVLAASKGSAEDGFPDEMRAILAGARVRAD